MTRLCKLKRKLFALELLLYVASVGQIYGASSNFTIQQRGNKEEMLPILGSEGAERFPQILFILILGKLTLRRGKSYREVD